MENLEEKKKYELVVIYSPDLGEKETANKLKELRELLIQGGEISHEDIWGVRELSYRIKKQDTGFYAVVNFASSPDLIRELDKTLRLDPTILRQMIMTLPRNYEWKTLKQYEEEAAKAEIMEKKAKAKAKTEKAVEKPKKEAKKEELMAKVEEELTEPVAKPAEEPTKEAKKTKKAEKTDKQKLEEVEEKLKSIIENPDIKL